MFVINASEIFKINIIDSSISLSKNIFTSIKPIVKTQTFPKMKTFKALFMMMLFALVTLSSCDNDDTDLTGDLIITTYGDYYSGGTFEIFTEASALAERTGSAEFYPSPLREGYIYDEYVVEDLNHGTYYIVFLTQGSAYGRSMSFQISGGKTTEIFAGEMGLELLE